uniref:Uncharacterized protein n=1 Tax=Onchocerca volvulus TaxID=6282 RepID=A0A8R1U0Q1_ONCVO
MLNRLLLLWMTFYGILLRSSNAITKSFVNSSMPDMRPTFVVNFDTSTVICQHSSHPDDLHLHHISILCDGEQDCYSNPAMHDESFPYCGSRCNSTCNQRGACLFDGIQGQCYCNAGFHGPQCELDDNNECKDKPCHWLAHCRNTYGSFSCSCFPGFQGDGHECSDINECETGIARCPKHSTCVNLPGTYFCNCTEGFQPLGIPLERCADIDECAQEMHNCSKNFKCQNEIGKFKCVEKCDTGYRLVNGTCIDIDECTEKTSECNKRANCVNTIGSYQCICEDGFTGDALNDCSQQKGICDRHAFCIGSLRMCVCQSGYIGDGLNCYDVNECAAKDNPCEGQIGASRCVNIDGGYICCEEDLDNKRCIREKGAFCSGGCGLHAVCYNETCQCMEGFDGDPRIKCTDINECEDDKQCPGVGEWCVNMIGGFVCCSAESQKAECLGSNYKLNSIRRTFSTSSIQQKATGGFMIIDKQVTSAERFGLACYFGCPADSHCVNDTCRCNDGFIGNTFEGCVDINECELGLCNQSDSWCVNLSGSFACCTRNSTLSECIGLKINDDHENSLQKIIGEHLLDTFNSAATIITDDTKNHGSWSDSSDKNELSNSGQSSSGWAIKRIGEWRNFTGHAIIFGRGRIESKKWNMTKDRNGALIDIEVPGNRTEEIHFTSSTKEERTEANERSGETEKFGEDIKTSGILGGKGTTHDGIPKVDASLSSQANRNSEKGSGGILAVTSSLPTVNSFGEVDKNEEEETKKSDDVTSKTSINHESTESNISLERSSESSAIPVPTLKSSRTSASESFGTVSNEIIIQDSSGKFTTSEFSESSTYMNAKPVSEMESTNTVELETTTILEIDKTETTIVVKESDLTESKESIDTMANFETKQTTRVTDKETDLTTSSSMEKQRRIITTENLETHTDMTIKENSQNQTIITEMTTSSSILENKSDWKTEEQKLQPENTTAKISETDVTIIAKHETITPTIIEATPKETITVISESDSASSVAATHSNSERLTKFYGTSSPYAGRFHENTLEIGLEIAKAAPKTDRQTRIERMKTSGESVEVNSTSLAYPSSTKPVQFTESEKSAMKFKSTADLISVSQKTESKKSEEIETTQTEAETTALERSLEQSTEIQSLKTTATLNSISTINVTQTETEIDTLEKSSETISSPANQETTANLSVKLTSQDAAEDVTAMQREKTEPVSSHDKSATTETENGEALQTKSVEVAGSGEEMTEFRTTSDTNSFISNTPIETNNFLGTTAVNDKTREVGLEIVMMKKYPKTTKPPINRTSSSEETTISSVKSELRSSSDIFTEYKSHDKKTCPICKRRKTIEGMEGKSTTEESSTPASHDIEEATTSEAITVEDFKKTDGVTDINITRNTETVAEPVETISGIATTSTGATNEIEMEDFSKFLSRAMSTKPELETTTTRSSTSGTELVTPMEKESVSTQEATSSIFRTHTQSTVPFASRIWTSPSFSPTEIIANNENTVIVTNSENFPSLLAVSGTEKVSKPVSISEYVEASATTSASQVSEIVANGTSISTKDFTVFQRSESSATDLFPLPTVSKSNLEIISATGSADVLKTASETTRWMKKPEEAEKSAAVVEMTTTIPGSTSGTKISESTINPSEASTKVAKVTSETEVTETRESIIQSKQTSSKVLVSDKDFISRTEQETTSPVYAKISESGEYISKKTTKETYSLRKTTEISITPNSTHPASLHCRSSDECGADAYCERRSGVCRCYPGFDGEPPTIPCVDINECERHLDDCDISSRCSNKVGGFMCFCETGYRMSREHICVDINECQERAGNPCSQNATCINMPGSYQCKCNHGYTGDGYTCIPIGMRHCKADELARSKCGRNHLCLVDDKGRIDCTSCKKGFLKEATECIDINECAEESLCHENAFCKNIMGSYSCHCQPGYEGDGFSCNDIDECLSNPCHPQAICFNYPGFYSCKCPDGWAGDGKNECINPSDTACLDKLSVCNQANYTSCLSVNLGILTTSICECASNYRYNSIKRICEDIDECAENRHTCDPSNSICINTDGSYICECAPGYEGAGGICVDVNECERGIAGCNVAARCENYLGSVGCKCPPGFFGNGIHCTATGSFTKIDSGCDHKWKRTCYNMNRTCHVDGEDVPQCGSCLIGYQPSSGRCLPIQQTGNCANPQKNDCDMNAECIDVYPGHHLCTCKVGYIGDGRRCDDIDECSLPGACDPAANCHNTNGSFTCICQFGYIGNGFKCKAKFSKHADYNCQLNVSMCHKNARCQLNGICKCNSGYQGNGIDICLLESEKKRLVEITFGNKTDFSKITKAGTMSQVTKKSRVKGSTMSTDDSVFASGFDSSSTIMPFTEGKGIEEKVMQITTDNISSMRYRQSSTVEGITSQDTSVTEKSSGKESNTAVTASETSPGWISETDHLTTSEGSGEDDSISKDWQYSTKDDNKLFTVEATSSVMVSVHESMEEATNDLGLGTRIYSGSTSSHTGDISREEIQKVALQRCTATDQSACHELATCVEQSGECVCKLGYHGDGYSICIKDTEDCILDPKICDLRAVCNVSTRTCKCIQGYIGDGIICAPDTFDCLLRPNLCSSFAECIGRRCICNAGYTGDGTECVEVEPLRDCTQCDTKAKCHNETCICDKGYFGNGAICIADPADCIHYPGLCHSNAICDQEKRRCKCTRGHIGNGMECSRKKDFLCLNNTNICDQNAECLSTGVCRCKHGFEGDGYYCLATTTKFETLIETTESSLSGCKQQCVANERCYHGECRCAEGYKRDPNATCMDIDECSMGTHDCHPVALCTNVPGSFTCICPSGYNGDGRKCFQYHRLQNMSVDCELDGMTLILVNDPDLYDGRIFVRGQTDNPFCSKKLNALLANESEYHLMIQYAHCNVRLEEPNTIAVTVVIQRHPMFITERADAYDVRCTYPIGVRKVASHVGISEITTTKTIVETGVGPTCSLTVTNEEDQLIDTATVGQPLKLALTVYPNDTYAVLPRNCFAINLETGELYLLTDEGGCAIDTELFPEWTYRQLWLTTARFRTFKWPDSSMIRFQCDCSACIESCPKVNCTKRHELIKQHRFRHIREIPRNTVDEELEKHIVKGAKWMAYSGALHVNEEEELVRAQRDMKRWKYQGLKTYEEPLDTLPNDICIHTIWIILSLLPLLLLLILIGLLSAAWRKKSSIRMRWRMAKGLTSFNDSESSYLKF